MKEEIERRRAEAAEKKKQKEESKEGSKAPFIAPKGASAKVSDFLSCSSVTYKKHHSITMWSWTWYYSNEFCVIHFIDYYICFICLTDW